MHPSDYLWSQWAFQQKPGYTFIDSPSTQPTPETSNLIYSQTLKYVRASGREIQIHLKIQKQNYKPIKYYTLLTVSGHPKYRSDALNP